MKGTLDKYPTEDTSTTSADIPDPETTIFHVTVKPLFSKKATPETLRIAAIGGITVEQPDGRGAEEVGVTLYAGDTGNHTPLLERAGKKSSVIDMPEATGCTEATMSIAAEPGNGEYPDFSEAVIGAKMSEIAGEDLATLEQREQAVKRFLQAIGEVAASSLLLTELDVDLDVDKGFVITFKPGERKEPSGDFYPTITADSPDSSAE
jgi:hypothetical protein